MQKLNKDQITGLIEEAIAEVAPGKVDRSKHPELPMNIAISELGIDSVASMEMVGVIEDKLGKQYPDEELDAVNTLGDLVTMIERHQG